MYPSIESSVSDILSASWNISDGIVVPQTEDLALKNGGRLLEATFLYADLANSSDMAQSLKKEVAAKIVRSYINTASRILRQYDGEIRSFDGDRVMAIFVGSAQYRNAVRAALAINWAVLEVIRPKIKASWSDGEDFYQIDHGIGIDAGEILIVRGGVRDNNDLISIGPAANIAAKLSSVRSRYSIYITDRVVAELDDDLLKYETYNNVWSQVSPMRIGGALTNVYGSNVYWGV